jgi:hypothetical protein
MRDSYPFSSRIRTGLDMMGISLRSKGLGENSTLMVPPTCEMDGIRFPLETKHGMMVADMTKSNSTHATINGG